MRNFRLLHMPQRTKVLRVVSILAVVMLFLPSAIHASNWLDDWLSSKTSTSPGTLEGQQRGYATGGAFSAHVAQSTNDAVISVSAPRLSVGCGGIDFNMGSLSWLKAGQLEKKLQGILTNAAFLAFDMALDTLCPKCSALMKAAESLSSSLNGKAINDCAAAKGLVTTVAPMAEAAAGSLLTSSTETANNTGYSGGNQTWTDLTSAINPSNAQLPDSTAISTWWNGLQPPAGGTGGYGLNNPAYTSGCTGIYATIFGNGLPASLMSQVASQLGFPDGYAGLMAGLVGDVSIKEDMSSSYTPSCAQNANVKLDEMIAAPKWWAKDPSNSDPNSACVQVNAIQSGPYAGQSLQQYVASTMTGIATSLQSYQPLTPDQYTFINSMPTAILYAMRMAVASGQVGTMVDSLSGLTAKVWLAQSLNDLMTRVAAVNRVASGAAIGLNNSSDTCNLKPLIAGKYIEHQEQLFKTASTLTVALDRSMQDSLNTFTAQFSIAQTLTNMNDQIKKQTANVFGPAIAARATRYF